MIIRKILKIPLFAGREQNEVENHDTILENDATIEYNDLMTPVLNVSPENPNDLTQLLKVDNVTLEHECGECGKCFQSDKWLERHFNAIHLNAPYKNKGHQCNDCGKYFVTPSKLQRHVEGVHNIDKKFKCKKCNKGFTQKPHLDAHMVKLGHDLEDSEVSIEPSDVPTTFEDDNIEPKKTKCNYCGKEFKSAGLEHHITSMHLKRLKEFRCENCGESFGTTDQVKRHYESKHIGEEPKSKLYIASTKPKKKKKNKKEEKDSKVCRDS